MNFHELDLKILDICGHQIKQQKLTMGKRTLQNIVDTYTLNKEKGCRKKMSQKSRNNCLLRLLIVFLSTFQNVLFYYQGMKLTLKKT